MTLEDVSCDTAWHHICELGACVPECETVKARCKAAKENMSVELKVVLVGLFVAVEGVVLKLCVCKWCKVELESWLA